MPVSKLKIALGGLLAGAVALAGIVAGRAVASYSAGHPPAAHHAPAE